MISEREIDDSVGWLMKYAALGAECRATRMYMEQYLKVRKAELQAENAGMSAAQSEIAALASPQYKETLGAYRDAVMKDEAFRFKHAAHLAKIDAWRTQEASSRTVARVG